MRGLKDKIAVVTGGGQGIGRALTLRLAEEGCKVAIFDLKPEAAKETEGLAPKGSVTSYELDVGDYAAVVEAVAKVEADLGPIWALVNNAGWDRPSPFLATDKALWDKIVHINLYGPLNTHHVIAPLMVKRGGGRIINIASDAARVGTSNEAVYSACKGGLISFTKSVARELASKGVLLNAVCPGPTNTPMMASVLGEGEQAVKWKDAMVRGIPLKRMGEPEDYAGIVAFLASDDASFMTGQTVSVAGGMNIDLTERIIVVTDAPVFEDILYEKRDNRAAWIIINRPKLYNAFRAQTMEELIKAFQMAGYDKSISSIVLTGAGDKAFCTGGDQSAHEGQYDGRGIVGLPIDEFQSIIRDVPKPVIARVNGFAIGGGNVFATLCDLTIAADTAKFGQVGPKVGSVDAGWGTALLARHIGDKRAREMWFLNEQYTAQQAYEMGLVNKVVPLAELDANVRAWTDILAERSPTALAIAKRSFNADSENIRGISLAMLNTVKLFYETEESKEGVRAFKGKRKPDFHAFVK